MASEIALACGLVTIVDDADVDLLCSHKWHRLVSSGIAYARSSMKVDGRYKSVLMHRFLLGPTGALESAKADHAALLEQQATSLKLLQAKGVGTCGYKPMEPWSEQAWLNKAKRVNAHKPFSIPECAQQFKELAEKAGWLRVEVAELKYV